MKKIVLLGASGSIGLQTVDVCLSHPDLFKIVAFSIGKNLQVCEELIAKLDCDLICVASEEDCKKLQLKYPQKHFVYGDEGLMQLASIKAYDVLVNALVGFVGLSPTLKAISQRKDIALANKETLVVAGKFVMDAVKKNNVHLYPIDSEHSAIFQALNGNKMEQVNRLIITASGGSFRDKNRDELVNVTVQQALAHPNWSMGAKITIDSATMMNKGFEVIEAHWLFDIPFEKIDVIIHPQSIIHSMVEYCDNSIIAQLGTPDMRLPIQYALSYPDRYEINNGRSLDFNTLTKLDFKPISFERFPLLKLAYDVGKKQGNLPAYLNAANEEANRLFLEGKINFLDIETLVINAVNELPYQSNIELEDIYKADKLARKFVNDSVGA